MKTHFVAYINGAAMRESDNLQELQAWAEYMTRKKGVRVVIEAI